MRTRRRRHRRAHRGHDRPGRGRPVHEALALRERYGVRLHVDAAYGGFFTLLAAATTRSSPAAPFRAIAQCDSRRRRSAQARPAALRLRRGAVRRPGGRALLQATTRRTRTSPSAELHLGEISLECSRAGAAAAGAVADAAGAAAGARRGPRRRSSPRGAARRWTGRPAARAPTCWRCTSSPSSTSSPTSRAATRCRRSTPPAARVLTPGMDDPDDPVFLQHAARRRDAFDRAPPELGATPTARASCAACS